VKRVLDLIGYLEGCIHLLSTQRERAAKSIRGTINPNAHVEKIRIHLQVRDRRAAEISDTALDARQVSPLVKYPERLEEHTKHRKEPEGKQLHML
jgi:hypothetical protein